LLPLKAVSIAPAARQWLQTSTAARVLHVFDNACNLVNDKGQVLSLVTAAAGNAPFAVVVAAGEHRLSFAPFVKVHSQISLGDDLLRAGPVALAWHDAAVWQPRPPWEQLCRRRSVWPRYLPLLAAYLHDFRAQAPGTAIEVVRAGVVYRAAWQDALALLREGLKAHQLRRCRDAAARLAGLGEGLTPSGDDFLLGVMVALWSTYPAATAAQLAACLAQAAVPRTTLLSAAWLEAAARGEAAASWHALLEALIGDDTAAMCRASSCILQAGHSSGMAALAGFIFSASSSANLPVTMPACF
jgi:hypothetical protein